MRVSELAKALKLSSKELLDELKKLRVKAAASTSTLDADAINRVRKALLSKAAPKKPAAKPASKTAAKTPAVKTATAVKKAAPVATTAAAKPASRAAASAAVKTAAAKPAKASAMAEPPAAPVAAKPAAGAPATATIAAPPKAKPIALPAKPVPVAETALVPAAPAAPSRPPKQLELRFPVTVKDLAEKIGINPSELIKHLLQQKIFAAMLQPLSDEVATNAANAFNCEVAPQPTLEEQLQKAAEPDPAKLKPRAPVVTFMGHVDHGKTSLLDAIREAKVAEKEAGGITQHIGAYEVLLDKGHVTFLDTPGHEAFTALRARGAHVTDIVVLVVAADDGVMPQTVEAMDHAKAADVPIIVAMNKSDKPEANPQKVQQQLSQHGLMSEAWGGKTIMVPVSARTRDGLDTLLEMLLLEAELLELKADPTCLASGTVIEAKQTKDRGPVATVLVQQGTLHIGETVVMGNLVGRVRAMVDDRGHRIKEAGPSKPVEILGLPEVPQAGDQFIIVPDEKLARQLAESRRSRAQQRGGAHAPKRVTLQELHQQISEGKLKELRLIVKADVQGSLEAIVQSLEKLDVSRYNVGMRILHSGVGDVNESDIILAAASDAIVVGFHVGVDPKVQVLAAAEGVDLHIYQIIYELVGAITAAIEGLLEPTLEETFVGRAEIRKLFPISKGGNVAGCMVTKGVVRRDSMIRVIRGRDRIAETKISSLKRVKDDAREVQEGVECGIILENSPGIQVGDLLEAWDVKKVARKIS